MGDANGLARSGARFARAAAGMARPYGRFLLATGTLGAHALLVAARGVRALIRRRHGDNGARPKV